MVRISYQKVRETAKRYDLPVCFSYYTFSSETGKERFRVCFLHKYSVTDSRAAKLILEMLIKIFSEGCDTQCSDLSRMFYGGKGLIEQGQGTFDVIQLAISFQTWLRQREGSQYRRNLKHFAGRHHISVKGGSLAIFNASSVCEDDGKNVDFQKPDYYIIIGADGKPTISDDTYMIKLDTPDAVCISDAGRRHPGKNKNGYKIEDIGDKAERCRLLTEFLSGEDVGHDGRFHIVTNFLFIRGGKRLFLGTIEKYGYDLPKWKETYGGIQGITIIIRRDAGNVNIRMSAGIRARCSLSCATIRTTECW